MDLITGIDTVNQPRGMEEGQTDPANPIRGMDAANHPRGMKEGQMDPNIPPRESNTGNNPRGMESGSGMEPAIPPRAMPTAGHPEGMESGQAAANWMPHQSGTGRCPAYRVTPQSGTVYNPSRKESIMPPQSGTVDNPSGMESGQFPTDRIPQQFRTGNPLGMESAQSPVERIPVADPLQPAHPPMPSYNNIYDQFSATDTNAFRFLSDTNRQYPRNYNLPGRMATDLLSAAISGNVNELQRCRERRLNILSQKTPAGETALHMAARNGHQKFVEKLLELPGEDAEAMTQLEFVKAKNREGNTALHVAAGKGFTKIVQKLLAKYKGLAHETNYLGETALFNAVGGGHADIVKELPTVMKGRGGETPLHLAFAKPNKAVLGGHAEIVGKLLGHSMKRLDGMTPLHFAFANPNIHVIDELVAHIPGLVQEPDNFDRVPLHVAAHWPMPKSPPPIYLMRERRRYRDLRQIYKMLIEKDRSVCYMVDQNTYNPFHAAVIYGNAALMREMLHHCSDCSDMVTGNGSNPLHLAVYCAAQIFRNLGHNFRDVMEQLMEEKFINATNVKGQTPLDIAYDLEPSDPQLFKAIQNLLKSHGGITNQGNRILKPGELPEGRVSEWSSNIISVNAVLLATVAFQVAFTLPGKHDSADINSPIFQVLVLFDALAFCFSIASALLLVYSLYYSKNEDPLLTDLSMNTLRVALVSTGMTFGAAIHMVVASKCLWLAVIVWVMVCYLPIWIVLLFFRGKAHLVGTRKRHQFIKEALAFVSTLYEPVRPLVNEFIRAINFIRVSLAKKVHQP
ncbi:ankyrin repeat-containing protein At5g02620 isoform X1 [Cryptomeria japonica]|uniref:ankyrin repeat-containing protein At5g02620 isoform X1 n=1 Tax=Cryptomeria japonica TaxID=3369 RepID=UPI0025ACA9D1|nr:ankyrin repeat-containing protein At5g02620 isoform X1 [Cryptomeria japonica]